MYKGLVVHLKEHVMVLYKLAPSILTADFARLGEQIGAAEQAGVEYIHVDVMDGHFVPNITIGPLLVKTLRRLTRLPLDVHLMIERPEQYIRDFAQAGATILTVHQEVCPHLHRTLQQIRAEGCRAGVALNPATPLVMVEEVLEEADLFLIMTVNPGFGSQTFIERTLDKIGRMRRLLDDRSARAELEVDGGIKSSNVMRVAAAGADIIVAGSAVFRPDATVQQAVAELRSAPMLPVVQ
jgi:ribulose-phosphate 3-epimerase